MPLKNTDDHIIANLDDELMLYRVANYYYKDELSQSEIAHIEHVSRPHISRLLAKARENGIVKIEIAIPQTKEVDAIKDALLKLIPLKYLEITYIPEKLKDDQKQISAYIALKATECLADFLSDCKMTGIGWGYTIYKTSRQLEHVTQKVTTSFYPLVGVSGENNTYLQTNFIVSRFAEKFNCPAYYTNTPIVFDNNIKRSELDNERYNKLDRTWKKLDSAIIGLGPAFHDGDFLIGEVSEEYKEKIASSNAVGDILASFFTKDGKEIDTSSEYKKVSIKLDQLRKVNKVLCLAGGKTKVEGIYTAIKMGYINSLITDSITALSLIDYIRKEEKSV